MEKKITNGFNEITLDEMNDVNGGSVTLGTVIAGTAIIIGGSAVVGFIGGCIYEAVLG